MYIGENVFSITNAFILSLNSLGNSLFLGNTGEPSKLIFYVLTDSPDSTPALTTVEQAQVTAFIRQLSPANMAISVDYTQSTSSLQLVNINNTYFEDPRQDNSYCIAFNQNILDQALGYTSHLDGLLLRHLTGFSITPISGTVLTSGNSYPITITSVPAWTGVLPLEQYFQIYSSDSSILTTSFDGTTLSLKALSVGSASVNLYLGTLNHSNGTAYNYTIM